MTHFADVNWLAVLLAAVGSMVLGHGLVYQPGASNG